MVDPASDYDAIHAAVQQEFGLPLDLPGLATTPTREAFTFARWQEAAKRSRHGLIYRADKQPGRRRPSAWRLSWSGFATFAMTCLNR